MRIVQVDAFTDRPFAGNPAAVCVLDRPADERWMQQVASEMNLSETAYCHPEGTDGPFRLRWFTPLSEVDLCGHATLATAHVLWEDGHLPPDASALFDTRSGRLVAHPLPGGWIELDFPVEAPQACPPIPELHAALPGAPVRWVGRNRLDVLVELETESALRNLTPDLTQLALIPCRGVIVTARSDNPPFDFLSRFFAPRLGVPEDPVCGSAHCALTPYWTAQLGKTSLLALQASPRTGVLEVRLEADRVRIAGQAVTTLRGTLTAGPPG